jgi:Na+/H+-dicarboxylate symporter
MKTLLKIFGILIATITAVWFGYWLAVSILIDNPDLSHSGRMVTLGIVELLLFITYSLVFAAVIAGVNELYKNEKTNKGGGKMNCQHELSKRFFDKHGYKCLDCGEYIKTNETTT